MSNSTGNFTLGSINKHLLSLTVPALITLISNMSFITVETYFVSHLGKNQLTAISFVFPIIAVFQMLTVGLGIAVSSVLSRLIGAGKKQEVSAYIINSFILAILLTFISIPILYMSLSFIFHLMGVNSNVMPYVMQFMNIWLVGVIFILASYIGSSILRVHGKAKLSAKLQIISSMLNIILSPLFISHLGMEGSALAGVIARFIMTTIMFKYIVNKYIPDFHRTIYKSIQTFWQQSKVLVSNAVPAILTNIIGPLSTLWMVHLLAKTGGDSIVAGFGIASRIEMIAVIPLYALSSSIGPIIGQNMGAKIYNRCSCTLIKSYQVSLLWSFFIAIALLFISHVVANIFTKDSSIIHAAVLYLSILPWSYASWGVIMMTNANFNSMGKPLISTMITILRLVVFFMPLSYILSFKFSFLGIFFAFAISNIITSLVSAYIALKHWRELNEYRANLSATAIISARD